MSQIDKVARVHPLRKRAIECEIFSACASCKHSKYRSDTTEGQMEFKGCSIDVEVTKAPKKCSDYLIDLDELENEEREFYEKNGIRWG